MTEINKYSKEYIESLKIEGFEEITIPAITYKSYRKCKFYEHNMIKSGWNPIYSHNCTHSNIKNIKHPNIIFGEGNLENDKTPEWCPYIK